MGNKGNSVFGDKLNRTVSQPVSEHKEQSAQSVGQGSSTKFKIQLDDSCAKKRTFYVRHDISDDFDVYAVRHKIDKGALMNLAIKEWMEQNKDRTQFPAF